MQFSSIRTICLHILHLSNSSPQGAMTVSVMATQGDADSPLTCSSDPHSGLLLSSHDASPPPTLVPITNIPPPQPLKPQVRIFDFRLGKQTVHLENEFRVLKGEEKKLNFASM